MYSPFIRALLGGGGLILTFIYFQNGSTTAAYLTLVGVALVVWGYFKNGTIYIAWKAIKKNDLMKAEKIVSQTHYPEFLKSEQRAYYHFIKGIIEGEKKNLDEAYQHFSEALKHKLRTENDTAIINVNLAEIEIEKGRINNAKDYLLKARALQHKELLDVEILKLEEKISNTAL